MSLPTEAAARKAIPIYSGFFAYFPRAIAAVAALSKIGNDQHNPGHPLHWDRSKSGDEKDAMLRHLLDQTIDGDEAGDTDGVLHATKKAWRAMADLEKILEKKKARIGLDTRNTVGDVWTEHNGGPMPCSGDREVDVRFHAKVHCWDTGPARRFEWEYRKPKDWSVVAWRYAE